MTKGDVGIENYRGKIRLRLPRTRIKSNYRHICTRLEYTEKNKRKITHTVLKLEELLEAETIESLAQAKDFVLRQLNVKEPKLLRPNGAIDWIGLWEEYCEFVRPQLAVTTYKREYKSKVLNLLHKAVKASPNLEPERLPETLIQLTTKRVAVETVSKVRRCLDWAQQTGRLTFKVTIPNILGNHTYKVKIDPFSREEINAILEAFQTKKPRLYPFVAFMTYTGCRIGEAIALRWENVSPTHIHFCESFDTQYRVRKETKTEEARLFPIRGKLKELLESLPRSGSLVFPNTQGRELNANMFTTKIWKGYSRHRGIMQDLIEEGRVQRYRKPYCLRHSFITRAIEQGFTVAQVAALCGNSAKTIFEHYLGNQIDLLKLDDLF